MIPGTYTSITNASANGIQYVGAGAVNGVDGGVNSTITWAYPTDVQANDVLVLIAHEDDTGSHVTWPPSGWTSIYTGSTTYTGFWLRIAYLVYSSGSSLTINTNGCDHIFGRITAWRGVNTSSVIDGSVVATLDKVTPTPNTFSFSNITTTQANSFVFNVVGHDLDTSTASVTWDANASLTNPTEYYDISTQLGWNGGYSLYGGIKVSAGAVNSATGTVKADSYKRFVGWAFKAA